MSYAKQTAARLIDQRARRRATQALLRAHHDEFRMLFIAERAKAAAEAGRLVSAPRTQSVPAYGGEPPRLMSGRYKPGQDATDRIDVARCPHCIKHHDRGHACAKCGARPTLIQPPVSSLSLAQQHYGVIPSSARLGSAS